MPTTRIDIEPGYAFPSYAERQKLYFDAATRELRPSTEIWQGDELQLRINSLGCKGDEIDTDLPVILVLGDSTAMGHAFTPDSWVAHVSVPGHAVLNAAVEGFDLERIAERFERLLQRIVPAAVVVYAGWHNVVYNRNDEEYWTVQLERFLGSAPLFFCTMATCVVEEAVTRGFDGLLNTADVGAVGGAAEAAALDADYFNFWMDLDPAEMTLPVFEGVARWNTFLQEFCAQSGATIIDLHAFLAPASWEEMPRDFYDVCHLRPRAYARVGAFVSAALTAGLVSATGAAL